MKLAVLALSAGVLLQAAGPRLFFSKTFPGSVPPFVAIAVERNGAAEYRDSADDENPLRFQLSEAEADEMFGLAEKLEFFKRPLESPLKVAFMGAKVFRYENGAEKTEVKFNFTEDLNGRALADWFERISESEQCLINLERSAKYDKLGILKALLQLETAMDRKRIVAPQQYLPLLDRVAKNETYIHAGRLRAAALADAIRAAK